MILAHILSGVWCDIERYKRRMDCQPQYVVMNYATRDKLRHGGEAYHHRLDGRIEKVFGIKILIDDGLTDDEVRVVGA